MAVQKYKSRYTPHLLEDEFPRLSQRSDQILKEIRKTIAINRKLVAQSEKLLYDTLKRV